MSGHVKKKEWLDDRQFHYVCAACVNSLGFNVMWDRAEKVGHVLPSYSDTDHRILNLYGSHEDMLDGLRAVYALGRSRGERDMSAERATVSAIVLTAMGDAWSDSEEYSALPGVTADLLLTSDWLAEHDRQVAERAWDEGFDEASDDLGRSQMMSDMGEGLNPYRAAKGEQK